MLLYPALQSFLLASTIAAHATSEAPTAQQPSALDATSLRGRSLQALLSTTQSQQSSSPSTTDISTTTTHSVQPVAVQSSSAPPSTTTPPTTTPPTTTAPMTTATVVTPTTTAPRINSSASYGSNSIGFSIFGKANDSAYSASWEINYSAFSGSWLDSWLATRAFPGDSRYSYFPDFESMNVTYWPVPYITVGLDAGVQHWNPLQSMSFGVGWWPVIPWPNQYGYWHSVRYPIAPWIRRPTYWLPRFGNYSGSEEAIQEELLIRFHYWTQFLLLFLGTSCAAIDLVAILVAILASVIQHGRAAGTSGDRPESTRSFMVSTTPVFETIDHDEQLQTSSHKQFVMWHVAYHVFCAALIFVAATHGMLDAQYGIHWEFLFFFLTVCLSDMLLQTIMRTIVQIDKLPCGDSVSSKIFVHFISPLNGRWDVFLDWSLPGLCFVEGGSSLILLGFISIAVIIVSSSLLYRDRMLCEAARDEFLFVLTPPEKELITMLEALCGCKWHRYFYQKMGEWLRPTAQHMAMYEDLSQGILKFFFLFWIGFGSAPTLAVFSFLVSVAKFSGFVIAARLYGNLSKTHDIITKMTANADPQVRKMAAQALHQAEEANLILHIHELASSLDDPDAYVRLEAVKAVGNAAHIHDADRTAFEQVPKLKKLLVEDPEQPVRWEAAMALGKFDKAADEIIPALSVALSNNEEDHEVRCAAAEALRKFGHGFSLSQALVKTTQFEEKFVECPKVRSEIACHLGTLPQPSPDTIKVLTRALAEDENEHVRREATRALGRINCDAANSIPTLCRRLELEPQDTVRWMVAKTLFKVAFNKGLSAALVECMKSALKVEKDLEIKMYIAGLLLEGTDSSDVPHAKLLRKIEDELMNEDHTLRFAAAHVLCRVVGMRVVDKREKNHLQSLLETALQNESAEAYHDQDRNFNQEKIIIACRGALAQVLPKDSAEQTIHVQEIQGLRRDTREWIRELVAETLTILQRADVPFFH